MRILVAGAVMTATGTGTASLSPWAAEMVLTKLPTTMVTSVMDRFPL